MPLPRDPRTPALAGDGYGPGGTSSRTRRIVIAAAAASLFLAGAAGSALYLAHRQDPLARADLLVERGDLRAAQVELRNAIRTSPKDAGPHLRLANLQMKLADPVSADREYKLALSLGADRFAVAPLLADALLAQGLNDETLRRTPESGPTPAATAHLLYFRSIAQLGRDEIGWATESMKAARAAAPDSVEVPLIAARIAAARQDYKQAEAEVDAVLARDPKQIDALLMKQQMAAARGDHAAALDDASRAVASAPWSALARIRRATELMVLGRDDQSRADVDAVLAVQPRFIEAVYLHGILQARQGRFQDAALDLAQLDQSVGRFPQALYYKALVAANLGQRETADAYARRYNTLVPSDPDGVRLMARADIALGASDHAVPILQAAVASGIDDAQTLDLLGSAQGNLGNTPAAVAAFRRALAAAPDDPQLLTHLGLAQMQSGATDQAFGTLVRVAETAAAPPLAGEALVSAAIAEGDLVRAAAALAALRAKVGDTAQTGILAGMIEVRRRDLDAARVAFGETMRRFPAALPPKLDYAKVLVEQGRRLDGMALMAEVLAKEPANVPALNAYLPLVVQNRQLDRLVAVLEAAHAANPGQAGFTATLADALVLSGDGARAVSLLRSARAGGPLPPLLLAALARAQAASGEPQDAKANFREVLRLMPGDVVDRVAFIDVLLGNKEYDVARMELETALQTYPRNVRFMSTLVELEAQTKGIDAGLRLAEALRADPVHMPFASLLKGDALMRGHRFYAAARAYLDEYALDPAVPPLLRAAAAYVAAGQEADAAALLRGWLAKQPNTPAVLQDLAKLELRAGQPEQAQAHLEALLTMLPNDPTALNNLAYAYQRRGDKRARQVAQKAYLQDGDANAADTLGWIMAQAGEAGAALPLLQQAGATSPSDRGVQYHIAATLKAAGRPADAVPVLQAILTGRDDFPDRPAAEQLMAELSQPAR